jgi:hypothetical protein
MFNPTPVERIAWQRLFLQAFRNFRCPGHRLNTEWRDGKNDSDAVERHNETNQRRGRIPHARS